MRAKTIKLLHKNREVNLYALELGNDFMDMKSKGEMAK